MSKRTLHARLAAYEPFGTRIGILPQPTAFNASILHNDDGALTLTYSRKALAGDILARTLEHGLEIALEVSDGTSYHEPHNARYLAITRSNNATDATDTITINAPSISWLLSKILNNDTSHLIADGDNKGKRAFLSANPGTIIKTLLDENKTRKGAATGIATDFTTGTDSNGDKWASIYTLYYSLGVSVQTALASLVGGGGADWRTNGRTLQLWNPDSTALSRDLSPTIQLRYRQDITDAPNEESISDLSSDILVEGDNGLIFRENNPAAPTPWGRWESYVSQGGVSDEATAKSLMQATLGNSARVRGQYTRSLNTTNVDTLPLVDYHPGDWISAPTVNHGEKVRIQEIDIASTQDGLTATVTLNDIKYDAQVKANKKIQGITGGAALAGSENGRPAPETDHRVPQAPKGLVVASSAYISSNGTALGLATLRWDAVTKATDNTSIGISHYIAAYRKNLAGAPWVSAGVSDATATTVGIGGLECGVEYGFRVRAVPTYSDQMGEWSDVTTVRIAADTTPPSVPSKPIASSELGVADVQWDGLNSSGGRMELDFSHCELGMSESNGNWSYRDKISTAAGHSIITGLTIGKTYWFALRSVDRSGNKSAWSASASVTISSVIDPGEFDDINQRIDQAVQDMTDLSKTVTSIDGKTTVSGKAPTSSDTAGKPEGAMWTQIDGTGKVLGMWMLSSGKWIRTTPEIPDSIFDDVNDRISQAEKDVADLSKTVTSIDGKTTVSGKAPTSSDTAGKPEGAMWTQIDGTGKVLGRWYLRSGKWLAEAKDSYTLPDWVRNDITSALTAAKNAQTTADAKNRIYTQSAEPSHSGLANGDLWRKTDSTGTIIGEYVWNGKAFTAHSLSADSVLLPGSLTGSTLIKPGSITVGTIHIGNGEILTGLLNARKITTNDISANGLDAGVIKAGYLDAARIKAGSLDASQVLVNGSIGSVLIADGAITATNIRIGNGEILAELLKVRKITTSDITTAGLDAGVIKAGYLDAARIKAGSLDASQVLVKGSIDGGVLIKDGSILAKNIHIGNGEILTELLKARKITADDIKAGTFTGYTFTGSIFQSSTSTNTGWKLKGGALDMWDSSHNPTVHLDGEGKSNLITGTFQTGMSGNRVVVSPNFSTTVVGVNASFTGSGISFPLSGSYQAAPFIATESTGTTEGNVSALIFHSGQRDSGALGVGHGYGSFGRIGVRRDSQKRQRATVYFIAGADYSHQNPDTSQRKWYSDLSLLTPDGNDTTSFLESHSPTVWSRHWNNASTENAGWRVDNYSSNFHAVCAGSLPDHSIYAKVGNANGEVGITADINTGYLFLGGFLGGLPGRATFQTGNWAPWRGSFKHNWMGSPVRVGLNPAKYGHYHALANADCPYAGIQAHVTNTGNASSFDVLCCNLDPNEYNGTIWCDYIAFLEN
ncbi:hypothetical protein EP30_01055 [Bifidobacterium sp. UTCIF-39]|uniref:hypothetical protein n=1 Tax=Bifidobacterium sp. UTCIF-39 TaxID=1465359 RepID=UPI00112EE4CB|nr:hypothetical protein [Bifidobacterium sp. UTCIF-39]TPF97560.1 hypothetical protein EP30_01055 [Bifidobacterium sp. UTCIF-39]